MAKRSYAVIGAGGVGGYYGGRLQKAGFDVHYLLRSDYDHVKQHGLRVDSVEGNFVLPEVHAYSSADAMPQCDVVLVTLKTTQNHLLKSIVPPILRNGSIVVLLQNGLGEEDRILQIPGVKRVVAGLAFVCAAKLGPGHIAHQDYGAIRLADHSAAFSDSPAERVADDFRAARIMTEIDPNSSTARWKKLLWNIPFNGLSVVCNSDTAGLVGSPVARELVRGIMSEVVQGAYACGADVPRSLVEAMIETTEKMRPYYPSMKLDFDARRPMELDSMYRTPIDRAKKAGVHMVRTDMLYRELFVLESVHLR